MFPEKADRFAKEAKTGLLQPSNEVKNTFVGGFLIKVCIINGNGRSGILKYR
jgi:hypothetical protein